MTMEHVPDTSCSSEEQFHLLSEKRLESRDGNSHKKYTLIIAILSVLLLILPPVTYNLGLRKGRSVLPHLNADAITGDAIKYEPTYLDLRVDVQLDENKRFKGPPRPELDKAWEDVTEGMHIRVSPEEAKAAGFESVVLDDGSGDSWGSPAVFHTLHCLRAIRQAQYPEIYPDTWSYMGPEPDGSMSDHFDHCIDLIRQTIMCHGDMTLAQYSWLDESKHPAMWLKRPHMCVNWKHLQNWAIEHKFSIWEGILTHPKFGKISPATWDEPITPEDIEHAHA